MTPSGPRSSVRVFLEKATIPDSEKNLRSKIDSIIHSIENLTTKRARIDFEIKRQKRSLERKRMELKKSSKHLRSESSYDVQSEVKPGILLESGRLSMRNIDDYLLQESNRILEQ